VTEVHGAADDGFGAVVDAFRKNFDQGREVGAAFCLYRDGAPVVDVWAGDADGRTGRAWERDTIVPVFSTTKGVTAIVANLLIQRGLLDPDAPVARYWPEFAAGGKEAVTVAHLLSHTAGLPVIEGEFTLDTALAWNPVVEQLATQAPRWTPGEPPAGYHMRSYGWLVGEVVRRVTGQTIGRVVASDLAGPLGLSLWIGLPASEESRVATLEPPPQVQDANVAELMAQFFASGTMAGDALTGPSDLFHYDDMWNTRELHACELPSSNGITDARSLARLYAANVGEVDGVRVLDDETVRRACVVLADGADRVLGVPMRYGLGFERGDAMAPSCPPSAFGHPGAGGSMAFGDPAARVGFGYVMNQMDLGITGDPRAERLVRASYRALG
jgi:CubicO group peptidase (beta-lactamase class C family)